MTNDLSKVLSNATDAEASALMDRFDPEAHLDEDTKARLHARISQSIRETKASTEHKLRFPWKAVLGIAAACAAVYLTLGFTVPGVADTLYRVFHPDYRTEAYFSTPPEQRQDPVMDLKAAVGDFHAQDVESKVELLGEYTMLTRYDAEYNDMANNTPTLRETYGFSPYRQADYAYLRDMRASVRELYYDGERLFVTAFVATEHPEWLLADDEAVPPNLELAVFDFQLTVNGEAFPMQWNVSSGGGSGITVHDGEKGLWVSTEIDLTEPLPDGRCELLMLYYVYDCDVDDMGAIGNVGRVIHRIAFESKAVNTYESKSVDVTFKGSAPMTLATYGETGDWETLENRTVSFDGLSMRFTAQYLPSGLKITGELLETPADWTEQSKDAFVHGFIETLSFDAICNGESVELKPYEMSRANRNWTFELPIFPSDYAGVESLAIVPKIRCLTSFVGAETYVDPDDPTKGVTTRDLPLPIDGDPVSLPLNHLTSTQLETPLDVRIAIPLP